MLLSLLVVALSSFVCLVFRVSPCWFLRRVLEGSPCLLVVLISGMRDLNFESPSMPRGGGCAQEEIEAIEDFTFPNAK